MDAFAGTGALGFEAASRGAGLVWMHEVHAEAFSHLQMNVKRLQADQVHLSRTDGLIGLSQAPDRSLDLVFLDPPFDDTRVLNLALCQAARVVRENGWVYLESDREFGPQALQDLGFACDRHVRAGVVHAHLLRVIA